MNDTMIIIGLLLYAGVLAILGKALWSNMALKKKIKQVEDEKDYLVFERGYRMLAGVLHLLESGAIAFPFTLGPDQIKTLYQISYKFGGKEGKQNDGTNKVSR